MSPKPAIREVTGPWVDAMVDEPCWVTLTAERIREPAIFSAVVEEPFSSAFQLTLSHNQEVKFELNALQTIITIQGPKSEAAKAEKD